MKLDLLLAVTNAHITAGLDHQQRAEFDRALNGSAAGDEVAKRRAFALAHGEM
jgi:hypothetical protein